MYTRTALWSPCSGAIIRTAWQGTSKILLKFSAKPEKILKNIEKTHEKWLVQCETWSHYSWNNIAEEITLYFVSSEIWSSWWCNRQRITSDLLWISCEQSAKECVGSRSVSRLDGALARSKFEPPSSKLRSFVSKCTVLKKVLVTLLGLFGAPAVIWRPPIVTRRPGNCVPLAPPLRPWLGLYINRDIFIAASHWKFGKILFFIFKQKLKEIFCQTNLVVELLFYWRNLNKQV